MSQSSVTSMLVKFVFYTTDYSLEQLYIVKKQMLGDVNSASLIIATFIV